MHTRSVRVVSEGEEEWSVRSACAERRERGGERGEGEGRDETDTHSHTRQSGNEVRHGKAVVIHAEDERV